MKPLEGNHGRRRPVIETDLTAEEKAIIAEGRAQLRAHPEDFVSLETILRRRPPITPGATSWKGGRQITCKQPAAPMAVGAPSDSNRDIPPERGAR